MSESKLQVAFAKWMPHALPEVTFWHVYNEAGRNSHEERSEKWGAIQGKMKKDRGVLSGVHDNHLIWPYRNYATLELKDPDKPVSANKYSPRQAEFARNMDKCGFPHACCQTGEQIESYLRSLGLNPLYRFPTLERAGRNMLQQVAMHEMYRSD